MGYARLRTALKATGLAAGLHLGLAATAGAADLCAEGVIVIREEADRRVVTFPGFHPFRLSTALDYDPDQSCTYDISVLSSGVFNVQFADVEIIDICETSRFEEGEFSRREPGEETPDSPGDYSRTSTIALIALRGMTVIVRWDSQWATDRLYWTLPLVIGEGLSAEATVGHSIYHISFEGD